MNPWQNEINNILEAMKRASRTVGMRDRVALIGSGGDPSKGVVIGL